MDLRKTLGLDYGDVGPKSTRADRIKYIKFKLAALGLESQDDKSQVSDDFTDLFEGIIQDYKEKSRLVDTSMVGIYKRINDFFEAYFDQELKVVSDSFVLDHYGLARDLSLPLHGDVFENDYLKSYRIKQGVLHNPLHDRRTTQGSFHIVEGGLAVPYDKKTVPKACFLKLYQAAINPPEALKVLPFTSGQEKESQTFVSLLVKPIVAPRVEGVSEEKTSEVLFIAPGSLVANLDFVESVFGNGGDPCLHTNDSGLDLQGWSGHTGYIILAPHLTKLRKIDVGLPPFDKATQRQRQEGMCYKSEDECYNDGVAFKLTCRDQRGVAVTLIGDNYFGYSKKEIKTQISYAANLYGNVEEEHSGGTIVFPRVNLGEYYNAKESIDPEAHNFEDVKDMYGSMMTLHEDNYGVDKVNESIIYLPENVEIDLHKTNIQWTYKGRVRSLKLMPTYYYILPNGDKINIEKHPAATAWKLVGTEAEGTFCHKPCTVSGGGKSEISKSLSNSIDFGSYYTHDLDKDLDHVARIIDYDYSHRWKVAYTHDYLPGTLLSIDKTLGSVIRLLTPSRAYTDAYNAYLHAIPNNVKALVFLVKRFYLASWGDQWRQHFTVDLLNGKPGNEVKYNNRKIRPSYLRVGFDKAHVGRVFKLRMDFMPAEKIQTEDDISASIMVPARKLSYLNKAYSNSSYKFSTNCEYRFFQRPDEAIHKGYDKQAEADLSGDNLFVTNYRLLTKADVQVIKDDVMAYISYSPAVKAHIDAFLAGDETYCIVSSEPRIVKGKVSKNPRYLENRKDFLTPIKNYLAQVGTRLSRKVPADKGVYFPVNAVLPGRRNNPPGLNIKPLSVYSPMHYQDLPELFMDYICSLSGKSPSTTGSGSEGALTKGPFNMLLAIYDLNNALLSYILGDYVAFTTPAGFIGPNVRVDHDLSMLMPEIWSRLTPQERDPQQLIEEGSLEKIEDFIYQGQEVPASRLGYRITETFAYKYLGKLFDEPQTIFSKEILRPEKQDLQAFVEGVVNIASAHEAVADQYFLDGGVDQAIEPLKALLWIMAKGDYKGHGLTSPRVRDLFKKENVLKSKWYKDRLVNKQGIDVALMKKKISHLQAFVDNPINQSILEEFNYQGRLALAKETLIHLKSPSYLEDLYGCLGGECL